MARRRPPHSELVQQVSELVRSGYGALLTFDAPGAWIELAGPNGISGGSGAFGQAPVTTVRLVQEGTVGVVAEAASDGAFAKMLDVIGEKARPFAGQDHAALLAMLRAVRELSTRSRTRMPTVGPALVEYGEPSVDAWLSCLTLADFEQTLAESCEGQAAA